MNARDKNLIPISSLEDLKKFAQDFASSAQPGTLVLLEGSMGVGKTQFVSYLVEALGGQDGVSPSYAIHESYSVRGGTIEHFDLFRLESEADLESTGFWDTLSEAQFLVVIEWAERLKEFNLAHQLPVGRPRIHLRFEMGSDQERIIRQI